MFKVLNIVALNRVADCLSPPSGLVVFPGLPTTACAVGCILSPLLRLGLIRLGGISFRIEFEWGSAYETAGSSPPLRAGSE